MLHSGSRNIGHTTASHYGHLAKRATGDREGLEYLHTEAADGAAYIRDMNFCQVRLTRGV